MRAYRYCMICFFVASIAWSASSVIISLSGNPVVGMLCAGMAFLHLHLSLITQPPPILKPWSYEDLTELRPPLVSEQCCDPDFLVDPEIR